MNLLTSFRSFASTLFRRSQIDSEVEEELRSHIQHRTDDLERSGLNRSEAERRARIEFGGNLRAQDPQLSFECGRRVDRKRRLPGDFGHQFDVVVRFFQQRADFIRKSRLANAMRSDQCQFQISAFSHQLCF